MEAILRRYSKAEKTYKINTKHSKLARKYKNKRAVNSKEIMICCRLKTKNRKMKRASTIGHKMFKRNPSI